MIETDGKNFISTLAHESEVIIGDENSLDFRPAVRLKKWGEESSLAIAFPTMEKILPTFDEKLGKISWTDKDTQVNFFEQPENPQWEHGGFEFEIVLGSVPQSPDFTFNIESDGLQFHLQGLQSFNKDFVQIIPANVVKSYAAYRIPKGVQLGGDKYRTGKVFHIYRPEAVDADGNKISLDLNVNTSGGQLICSIDPTWLLKAKYPVIIDPTFGYTSIGGSQFNVSNAQPIGSKLFTPSEAGTLNSIFTYAARSDGNTFPLANALYGDSGGLPQVKLAEDSGNTNVTTAAWYSTNFNYLFSASTPYHLALWHNGPTSNFAFYYDVTADNFYYENGQTFENWPVTLGNTFNNVIISIYASYTALTSDTYAGRGIGRGLGRGIFR